MSTLTECILPVPLQLTKTFSGVAIDMGASVLKIIYRSKEDSETDQQTLENETSNVLGGKLRFVKCARHELPEAMEYVKERAIITGHRPDGQLPTICTTGVGCSQHGRTITQILNVKIQQMLEFDCFAKAFHYMASHIPSKHFIEPFQVEAAIEPLEQFRCQAGAWSKVQNKTKAKLEAYRNIDVQSLIKYVETTVNSAAAAAADDDVPIVESDPDLYPCVLVMCGSSHVFVKIEQDGSFKMSDTCSRGGRSLYGMGCLLTACSTFDELISLAECGDARSLDQYTSDVNKDYEAADGDDSPYIVMASELKQNPLLLFSFGKSVGARIGDFKREDLARAWLQYCVLDLVQSTHDIGIRLGVKRVFFCGSFCSHPFVRKVMTAEYVRRTVLHMTLTQETRVPRMDFIKPESHLGTLGCVVTDLEKHQQSSQ